MTRRSRLLIRVGWLAVCWHRQGWRGWITLRRARDTNIVVP